APLEDAAVAALRQPGQRGAQLQGVAAAADAAVGLFDAPDQPVQAAAWRDLQPGGLAQQGGQLEIRLRADQLQADAVRPADGFLGLEGQHLQVQVGQGQVKTASGHGHSLSMYASRAFRYGKKCASYRKPCIS